MGMIQDLLNALEKQLAGHRGENIKSVLVEVGEMRAVVPEVMEACWNASRKPDILRDAVLNVVVEPVTLACGKCGIHSVFTRHTRACPLCGSKDVSVVSGNEFLLKGIEW